MKEITRPVWVEVDLEKIKFNYRQLKKSLPEQIKIMAVVKADAYGHGIIPLSRALLKEGVDRLGVAIPEEGVELREAGFRIPIQVLGEALSSEYQLIVDYDLIPTISREDSLRKINELAVDKGIKKKVHIKLDTGMGRLGITPDEKGMDFVLRAAELPGIEIEGLMTHFATAEESDKEYTLQQWQRFKGFMKELAEKGLAISLRHMANSAAMIDLPDYSLDMVRPGIVLYGYKPS
ncbi:MAG TPA: alanine racemase, partial [Halanaerobiales bacterium]|nr:alanine racemase [Halanaerobiales bacterium]